MVKEQQRATQGFVATLTQVRNHPSWVLLEIAWRWLFGIPAVAIVYIQASKVFASVPWQATNIEALTVNQLLTDPMKASATIADFVAIVLPGLLHVASWLAPVLLVIWAIVSGIGRTLVLRRMDSTLQPRIGTMIALQLLRILPLAALFTVWFFGVQALGRWTIVNPIASGGEPIIMAYVGGVIVLTLGLFVVSALIGWIFSLAPLLSVLNGSGVGSSISEAIRTGGLRSGLIEINLVLGIVKIALMILGVVFSACPLPFQTELTDQFLFDWNCAVAVWYFIASDYFHVARLAGYLQLIRPQSTQISE
ncbi:hypothetical protein [Terriglobus sp. TAA 43]|uniref:hypothetical protein n=1 Tax=Terriglobus sp. TAA 43 TaxID=278961 RepID=UPI0012ECEA69|nr:hypothetical protein [Terriglobus sp. TAA 43]